jgi:hypothetical protein
MYSGAGDLGVGNSGESDRPKWKASDERRDTCIAYVYVALGLLLPFILLFGGFIHD